MNNFVRNEVVRNNKTKDMPKRGMGQLNAKKKNRGMYEEKNGRFHHQITNKSNENPYIFTNNFTNIDYFSLTAEEEQPLLSPLGLEAPFINQNSTRLIFNKSNNLTDNGINQSINRGLGRSKKNIIGDRNENKTMMTQKIDETALSPSMFNGKKVFKSRISDDEMVINPKNVFYNEEPQNEKAPVIQTLPPNRKKYKKRTKEGENETNFKLHTDPVNRPCSNQMSNPNIYGFYNQGPRVNSAEPYSRSPLYMPIINPLHAPKFQAHYHQSIPHNSTLFRPQERKNLKINQDPFFFRIPQPMNNSLILNINNINHDFRFNNNELRFNINNDMRYINQDKFFIHPHGFIPHHDLRLITPINYIPILKTIFRLKVDAQRLYDFDYIDIQGDKIPDLSTTNVSDGIFATHLNKFNKKYGITQLTP